MGDNSDFNPLSELAAKHLRGRVREEDLQELTFSVYEMARVFSLRSGNSIEDNFEIFADFAVNAYRAGDHALGG